MLAHWGLAADGTHVVAMARTCGCGHAFAPDTVFCNACGVRHRAVETAGAAVIAAAPAAASDARAPPSGASSLFGGASLLFRGVASGDRGGAGGAWSSSPLESNLWPSINGSERLGASSLDGSSLGVTINEDTSRGGDDAGPLGTSEPTQQDHHHHHVHEAEKRSAGSSTASCKPAGRSCRQACARGSFRAPFCGSAPPSLRPSTSARRATWTWAGASSRSGLIGLSGLDGLRIHLEH